VLVALIGFVMLWDGVADLQLAQLGASTRPHYYLHIRNGDVYEDEDPDGEDLPDLDTAQAAAVQVACVVWKDFPNANFGMVIEVVDEDQMVLTIPLTEAVDPRSR
jgi:hypothetical protein